MMTRRERIPSTDLEMFTTTQPQVDITLTRSGHEANRKPNPLQPHYESIVGEKRLSWTAHHRLERLLGAGGQGVVYLSNRRGADNFTLPVAIKVFSPERFDDELSYAHAMERHAEIASLVARIQHDNLLDVQNFVDRNRIRMLVMEWVDGYDLQRLCEADRLQKVQARVSARRWNYLNSVVVTNGPMQSRLKPGVAVAIVRDCLAALAALHREGIIHGDIKPSNIMLKCTGSSKIIDIGSAFVEDDPPASKTCTPAYAAPEVLDGTASDPRSDLASLGYVLIELLAGQPPFTGLTTFAQLVEAKRTLPNRLEEILPAEVTVNELLMDFCRGLIAPDPNKRFPSAEDADLQDSRGAAAFHRQLVFSDLASEYNNEIRLWLEELKEIDENESQM